MPFGRSGFTETMTPDLLAAYERTRALTESLPAPQSPEDQTVQSKPDVIPTKWHRAHVTWFYETIVLERYAPEYSPFDPSFRELFNSYYEGVGPQFARARRGLLSRPGVDEIGAYRRHVDRSMERLLDSFPAGADDHQELADLVVLGLHHEQQHQELLLMDIAHVLSVDPRRPVYRPRREHERPAAIAFDWVEIESAGVVEIGHDGDGFQFDNEVPRHRTLLEPFRIANRLVTAGEWAEFIADELTAYVDREYRTDAWREARAVAGHSMGGYGAIHLTMERPDVFGIAYAMSPCCLAPIEDIGQSNDVWRRAAEVESWDEIGAAAEARDFWLVGSMGILTAFSPAPESPPMFVALPFGVLDGERVVNEDVFKAYRARFPLHRLDQHWPALASLEVLAIDYGIGDQFSHIPVGSRRFSERLAQLRVPHVLDVYDGDHREEIAERLERIVFPFIAERLTRPAD